MAASLGWVVLCLELRHTQAMVFAELCNKEYINAGAKGSRFITLNLLKDGAAKTVKKSIKTFFPSLVVFFLLKCGRFPMQ